MLRFGDTWQDGAWTEDRNSPETPVHTAKQASQDGKTGQDFGGNSVNSCGDPLLNRCGLSPDRAFILPILLTDLPRENDGTVKCQMYADGFFPEINILTESGSAAVVMTRSGACPNYNTPYDPAFVPGSAGNRINITGKVLLQNSQTPICAMVLANGQHVFSCDGMGSYAMNIPLDNNGQFKLQVYADGFAPNIQLFDEFSVVNDVRMARAAECQ